MAPPAAEEETGWPYASLGDEERAVDALHRGFSQAAATPVRASE
jgi:hypothetical protein